MWLIYEPSFVSILHWFLSINLPSSKYNCIKNKTGWIRMEKIKVNKDLSSSIWFKNKHKPHILIKHFIRKMLICFQRHDVAGSKSPRDCPWRTGSGLPALAPQSYPLRWDFRQTNPSLWSRFSICRKQMIKSIPTLYGCKN